MSITETFLRFSMLGAEWVMWLLVALSIVSIAVIFERLIFFLRRKVDATMLDAEIGGLIGKGKWDEAYSLVRESEAIECTIVAAGLREAKRGARAASEAMHSAKIRHRLEMERFLSFLGTLGSNAPFVGLLGTVLGIIKASHELTSAQSASSQAANSVMAGVFEALAATAVGLFVAIPAIVAYNAFLRVIRTRLARADALSHLVLSYIDREDDVATPPIVSDGKRG